MRSGGGEVWIALTPKHTQMIVRGGEPKRTKCGVADSSVLVGGGMKRLHPEGGADAWNRRERTTLLVEQIMRSALPFWVEL